jgi:hypothetical protein
MARADEKLSRASRLIGPEDVRPGEFVTIAETTWQYVCLPCDDSFASEARICHVTGWPEASGWPLKILKVCLPYAFAETTSGTHVTLDLRRHRLSRLRKSYGREVFETNRKATNKVNACSKT